MGHSIAPEEMLPESVKEVIRTMADSCTSEGQVLAELINDVASSAVEDDLSAAGVLEAMINTLDEVAAWAKHTKENLRKAFHRKELGG